MLLVFLSLKTEPLLNFILNKPLLAPVSELKLGGSKVASS